jgi:hypothetical protein
LCPTAWLSARVSSPRLTKWTSPGGLLAQHEVLEQRGAAHAGRGRRACLPRESRRAPGRGRRLRHGDGLVERGSRPAAAEVLARRGADRGRQSPERKGGVPRDEAGCLRIRTAEDPRQPVPQPALEPEALL